MPALISAFFIPMTLAGSLSADSAGGVVEQGWLPALYAAAMMIGYWGAADRRRGVALYVRNFGAWALATVPSALLVWAGMWLTKGHPDSQRAEAMAVARANLARVHQRPAIERLSWPCGARPCSVISTASGWRGSVRSSCASR